jgi:hypothetical protein
VRDAIGFNSLGYVKTTNSMYISVDGCDLYINEDRKVEQLKKKKEIAQGKVNEDITFIITSCQRYNFFVKTMDAFLVNCEDLHVIKKWVCVDDNSSKSDRKKMRKRYPFFDYVMKGPTEKGHAKSLNVMLKKVKTKYVFMFEDDWECLAPFKVYPYVKFLDENQYDQIRLYNFLDMQKQNVGNSHKLIGYINKKPIYGYVYNPNNHMKIATGVTQEFKDFYEDFEGRYNVYERLGLTTKSDNVSGDHYPGFSLNPSIFNVKKIKELGLIFEESDDYNAKFELYFAFQCWDKGVRIAQTHIKIWHIGDYASAYVLNGKKRFHDIHDDRVLEETKVKVDKCK